MAGIFITSVFAYLLGGCFNVAVFTVAWRDKGCSLGRKWLELASIVFFLWPLIRFEEFLLSIFNRERNRIARARRRV